VIYDPPSNVVRRMTVTFDPSFSNCSVSEQIGKASATPKYKGFDGVEYELLSVSAQSMSCSMREGNPFAGQ
jgi:hypothetical protein